VESLKAIAEKFSGASSSNLSDEEIIKLQCDRHNKEQGNLNETDGYNCSECNNNGYVFVPKFNESYGHWQEVAIPCKCQKARKVMRKLKKSGLQDAINKSFKTYEADTEWRQKLKEMAMQWTQEQSGQWMFIGGATGSGKTHLCVAAMLNLLKKGREVYYMLWREEVPKLKGAITDYAEYERIMNEIKNVDILYIDDLFKTGRTENGAKQRPTSADINIAFEIINHRYVTNKVTVITSECSVSDLVEIDQATAGRIVEKSGNCCVNLKGQDKDWRLKGGITL
jgi:DNA replication protein DnaC